MQRREKSCWELYTFLCASVDSQGMCKYSIRKIAQALQKGYKAIISAKNVLEDMDLIATRVLPEERNLTMWQVLSLPIVEGHYKARVSRPTSQIDAELLEQTAGMLVDLFYSRLGQDKVSGTKRQQGIKAVRRLLDDGFKIEEIRAAIDWSVKNVPSVHSFGIVEETIGQARTQQQRMAEREAAEQAALQFRDGDRVQWRDKRGVVEGNIVRFDDGVGVLNRIAKELEKL